MTRTPTPDPVEHLARRLADNDGWLIDEDSWERVDRELRKDYRDLARDTFAVLGGPTEAQQQVAALAAQVRELTRQRDRYRDAWHLACARAQRARRKS